MGLAVLVAVIGLQVVVGLRGTISYTQPPYLSIVDVDLKTGATTPESDWKTNFSIPEDWGSATSAFGRKTFQLIVSNGYARETPYRFIEVDVKTGASHDFRGDLTAPGQQLNHEATNGMAFFSSDTEKGNNMSVARGGQWLGNFETQHRRFGLVSTPIPAEDPDTVLLASNGIYGRLNISQSLLLTVTSGKLQQQTSFVYPQTAPSNYVVVGSTFFMLQSVRGTMNNTVFALWSHDVCPIRGDCEYTIEMVRTIYFGIISASTGEVASVLFNSDLAGLEFLRKADPILGWVFHYSPDEGVLVVLETENMWSINHKGEAILAARPADVGSFIEE